MRNLVKALVGKENQVVDEIYLQLYRLTGRDMSSASTSSYALMASPGPTLLKDREVSERSLAIMSIVSCYALPTRPLMELLRYWLYADFSGNKNASVQLNVREMIGRFEAKISGKEVSRQHWVPSTYELDSRFKGVPLKIMITLGEDTMCEQEVSPHITVNHVMIYLRDKSSLISKEPDKHMYWLYKQALTKGKFDKALPNEAKYCLTLSRYSDSIYALLAKWETKRLQEAQGKNVRLLEEADPRSMFLLKRRIFSTVCRTQDEIISLTPKAVKQMYFQCLNDYINLGVLDTLPRLEDVWKMAAYILHYKFRAKILKSREGELKKEMLIKHFEKTIPVTVRKEYNLDQWYVHINTFYNSEGVKDLDCDDCRRAFLSIYCKYNVAMSTYFRTQVTDAMSTLRVPKNAFCVVNANGVHFMPEVGRKDNACTIKYESMISVAGYKQELRLVAKDPNLEQKVIDLSFKVRRAREMAEDILTYGQIQLIERRYCSKVKPIDAKRLMAKPKDQGTSDNATSEAPSDIPSKHIGLKSVMNFGEALAEEDKRDNTVLTNADLEKYYKIGLKHYELKTSFLMYEQAFPLNVPPDVTGATKYMETARPQREREQPLPLLEQTPSTPIPELSREYDRSSMRPVDSERKTSEDLKEPPPPPQIEVAEPPATIKETQESAEEKSSARVTTVGKVDENVGTAEEQTFAIEPINNGNANKQEEEEPRGFSPSKLNISGIPKVMDTSNISKTSDDVNSIFFLRALCMIVSLLAHEIRPPDLSTSVDKPRQALSSQPSPRPRDQQYEHFPR